MQKSFYPPQSGTNEHTCCIYTTMTQTIDTILLDRDGTLIEEQHYLRDPKLVQLIQGVQAPWRLLTEQGCRFFLVTNQSGLGRGYFTLKEYEQVHEHLLSILAEQDMALTDTAFCPHDPDENCDCRKPQPGMWYTLCLHHNLCAQHTVMVGDKKADIQFGQAIGCPETVLVHTGHGQREAQRLGLPPLISPVQTCPVHPGWPSIQARSLGDYLKHLVQNRTLVHAHRI